MQASGKQSVAQIREIVLSGTLRQLETLRAQVSPEVAAMNQYPRLDPARPGFCVSSKKLKIGSVKELKQSLASGEIAGKLGSRIDAHVRQALTDSREMLLYDAEPLMVAVEDFLLNGAASGESRRPAHIAAGSK
jgi:hypothetical protein